MPVGRRLAAALTRPYEGGETDAARIVGRLTAIVSIAAGVIHVSAAGDHTNLPVMMAGFLVVATLQVGLGAVLLWRRPSRLLIAGAVALTLASVGIWLLSRTRGIPFLPDGHMEPVGFKDGITVLFELAALPGLLLLLSRELAHVRLPTARLGTQAMSMVCAGTFALMAPALLLEGGEHHSHDEAVALGVHDDHAPAAADHLGPGHARARHEREDLRHHADRPAAGAEHAHASAGGLGHVQLASLHRGHGGGGASPPGSGHRHAGARDRGASHLHRGERERHRGGRHRDRTHDEGGKGHGQGDPHAGHGDPGDSDDGSGLGDVPLVCEVAAAVADVC